MKHLKIVYSPGEDFPGVVLFDGPVDELVWTDSANQVTVSGKVKPANGKGVADLLSSLASGQKAKTANDVVRRRREFEAQKVSSDE